MIISQFLLSFCAFLFKKSKLQVKEFVKKKVVRGIQLEYAPPKIFFFLCGRDDHDLKMEHQAIADVTGAGPPKTSNSLIG